MADTFAITAQSPDTELNDAGTGFQQGWKIAYKVTSGPASNTVGTIFVTNDNHNATYVANAIAAKVKDLGDIAQLGS